MIAPEGLRRVQRQVHKLSQTRISGAGGSLSGLRRLRGADRSTGPRHFEEMRASRSLAPVVPVSQAPYSPLPRRRTALLASPVPRRCQAPPAHRLSRREPGKDAMIGRTAPVLEGCGESNLRHRMDSTSEASAGMFRAPRRERLT